jgi:hypothetical protein
MNYFFNSRWSLFIPSFKKFCLSVAHWNLPLPKFKRGFAKGLYIVFDTNEEAELWEWLFFCVLHFEIVCFDGPDNGYAVYDREMT